MYFFTPGGITRMPGAPGKEHKRGARQTGGRIRLPRNSMRDEKDAYQ